MATATKTTKMGSQTTDYLACEQTLLGALAAGGGGGGGGEEGELATTSLGILNSTSSSPVALPRLNCQISTNQR